MLMWKTVDYPNNLSPQARLNLTKMLNEWRVEGYQPFFTDRGRPGRTSICFVYQERN